MVEFRHAAKPLEKSNPVVIAQSNVGNHDLGKRELVSVGIHSGAKQVSSRFAGITTHERPAFRTGKSASNEEGIFFTIFDDQEMLAHRFPIVAQKSLAMKRANPEKLGVAGGASRKVDG